MKNLYTKEKLLEEINQVRKEIGHEELEIHIKDIYYNEKEKELWIITQDRPDKSAIIGKGGWVVGKLKEKLKINSIHVESYGDYLTKEYKLKLSKKTLDNFSSNLTGIQNLKKILNTKLENIYSFDYNSYFKNNTFEESEKTEAVVALSGGVDSSFSLILAKYLGFNPIAITIDPGTIILPNQYKRNIKKLTEELNVDTLIFENHPDLAWLACGDNRIEELRISNTPKLAYLSCEDNRLRNFSFGILPLSNMWL